jgi:peptidoglycan hydrolase CwlO-like protein
MKHHVDVTIDKTTTLTAEELGKKITQSNSEIHTVKQQLQKSVQEITNQVDHLTLEINKQNTALTRQVTDLQEEMNKQNIIILGMQKEFQQHMADFSTQLREIYSLHRPTLATPPASTSEKGQWGSNIK